jgi:hypothetical protein
MNGNQTISCLIIPITSIYFMFYFAKSKCEKKSTFIYFHICVMHLFLSKAFKLKPIQFQKFQIKILHKEKQRN